MHKREKKYKEKEPPVIIKSSSSSNNKKRMARKQKKGKKKELHERQSLIIQFPPFGSRKCSSLSLSLCSLNSFCTQVAFAMLGTKWVRNNMILELVGTGCISYFISFQARDYFAVISCLLKFTSWCSTDIDFLFPRNVFLLLTEINNKLLFAGFDEIRLRFIKLRA